MPMDEYSGGSGGGFERTAVLRGERED